MSDPGTAALTELASRETIFQELDRCVHSQHPVVVLVVRVEGMKSFNHAHGIRSGDELLAVIGERISLLAGEFGLVGKLSGEEFLIVLQRSGTADVAPTISEAARVCSAPVRIRDIEVHPRLAIGMAQADVGEGDVDQLLIEASAAMRAAAASTSDTVVAADHEIRAQAHVESVIDRDLAAALDAGALSFEYQPLVTLDTSAVHGAEALLRWNHPEIGAVNPALILQRFEAMGLTGRFTAWSANRLAGEWAGMLRQHKELEGMSVSFNLNESQLAGGGCSAAVADALASNGLMAEAIVIEVVESGRIGTEAEAALRSLAEAGTIIVLDDFGTGFNALEYFLRFPVHGIKFDRSLTHSIATNQTSLVIVEGVARIAEKLGVATVGEGIETAADDKMCRELGLTYGQGWHYGRPAPLAEFVEKALASRSGLDPSQLDRQAFTDQPGP